METAFRCVVDPDLSAHTHYHQLLGLCSRLRRTRYLEWEELNPHEDDQEAARCS